MSIEESLIRSVKSCETFSNVQRSLIALVIDIQREVSWSDLKSRIEEIRGPMNPNTLSFHLKKLIDADIIKRGGTESQPSYLITRNGMKEVEHKLGDVKKEMVGA